MKTLSLLLLVISCSEAAVACAEYQPSEERPECSDEALFKIVSDCRARRAEECGSTPFAECDFVKECKRQIDSWERCQ